MPETSESNLTQGMFEIFEDPTSQMPTSSLEDSLAPLLALLAKEPGSGWRTPEAHLLLRCLDSLERREYLTFSLRMSKDSSITTMEELLGSSSLSWMRWGMTVNGNCLTAKTLESHNTVNASSLSQILEVTPDQKYFLSAEQTQKMLAKANDPKPKKPSKSANGHAEIKTSDDSEMEWLPLF